MPTAFRILLTEAQLRTAGDMLRYDGAFNVDRLGGGGPDLLSVSFRTYTPARWESFTVRIDPSRVQEYKMSQLEYDALYKRAASFLSALRLTQLLRRNDPHEMFAVEGQV